MSWVVDSVFPSVSLCPVCLASTDWAWCCWSLTTWWSSCSTLHASSTSAMRTSRRGIAFIHLTNKLSFLSQLAFSIWWAAVPSWSEQPDGMSFFFLPLQFYSVGAAFCHRPPPHPHTLSSDIWLWAAPYRKPGLFSSRGQLQCAHHKASPDGN